MSAARPFHRALAWDARGMSAVELALVLPVLVMLLTGSIDVARGFAAKLDLEQAAQRTTDYALARKPASSDATYLKKEAAAAADVPESQVTAEIFLECDGVRQANFAATCPAGDYPARLVSVRIETTHNFSFDYGALTSLFGFRLLPASVTLSGDSTVRFQ